MTPTADTSATWTTQRTPLAATEPLKGAKNGVQLFAGVR